MGRAASDFRAGVEAAAKWLREADDDGRLMADDMIAAVGDDPEGTEARTVAQIVQYLRECSFGLGVNGAATINRVANAIEHMDWKRA